jgi:hypothetical protein
MDNYKELRELVENIEQDVIKYHVNENKAAGLRIKKMLKEINKLTKIMRVEILTIDKNR